MCVCTGDDFVRHKRSFEENVNSKLCNELVVMGDRGNVAPLSRII